MKGQDLAGAAIGLAAAGLLVVAGTRSGLAAVDVSGAPGSAPATTAAMLTDSGSLGFSIPDLLPGQGGTRCQTVTFRDTSDGPGAPAMTLRLYGQDARSTRDLASYLQVRIEAAPGVADLGCTGFAPARLLYSGTLAAFPTSWGSASALAPAAGSPSVRYRISYALSPGTPNSCQGGAAAMRFVWEARETG